MDSKNLILTAILAEYKENKAEIRYFLGIQTTLITFYVTLLATILSLHERIGELVNDDVLLFSVILPGAMIFLTVLWLDMVYRFTKAACYLANIEQKVNSLLGVKDTLLDSAMYWEQWLKFDMAGKQIKHIDKFYYCICLGLFVISPFISFAFACRGVSLSEISNLYIAIFIILLLSGIIFSTLYVAEIILLKRHEIKKIPRVRRTRS